MKRLAITGLALLMMAFASSAQASYVTEWSYNVDGIFTSWTSVAGTGSVAGKDVTTLSYDYYKGAYAPGSSVGYRQLEWGTTAQKSSIQLIPKIGSTQTLTTDSAIGADAMTLQHSNFALNGNDSTLRSGSVLSTLEIMPLGAPSGIVFATALEFLFFETINTSTSTERDIFVVMNPYVGTETFIYEGFTYDFTFAASFEPLTGYYADYARSALGLAAGTNLYGWTTAERGISELITKLQIRYRTGPSPTPEPASLALVGVGLAGLGAMFRRRRALKG